MDTNHLIVHLPFDNSTTEDLCGNTWTVHGSPTIQNGALCLNGGSDYLKLDGSIALGGQDFTINFYANANSGTALSLFSAELKDGFYLGNLPQELLQIELDYVQSVGKIYLFINGVLNISTEYDLFVTRSNYSVIIGEDFIGTIDKLRIYDGVALHTSDFTPFDDDDDISVTFNVDVERKLSNAVTFTAEVKRVVTKPYSKPATLAAWLPFDTSANEDLCGNTVTTYGNPVIVDTDAINGKALQLDGSSYLKISDITLGGKDFYIDFWVNVDSSNASNTFILDIANSSGYSLVCIRKNKDDATKLDFWANSTADVSKNNGYTHASTINSIGSRVHVKLLYRYSTNRSLFLYINDQSGASRTGTNIPQFNRQTFDIYIGASCTGSRCLVGTIDELRIYDGGFLTSGYGNPPTENDYIQRKLEFFGYAPVNFKADIKSKVINAALTWSYYNMGDADLLSVSGTTLTALPLSKSITGTAFYQTQRVKCFDLAATPEVWLKFDVYFDGSNRWRAFNGAGNDYAYNAGVTAQTAGYLSLVQNSAVIQNAAGICKTNQLQTVLLHMVSGSSNGVIEAWVDGVKIYTYTGDVNHGSDFADIYLQSDGAGTFFSNVIISNAEIEFGEGWHNLYPDFERKIANRVEVIADVKRELIIPIIVPFIGEHFNHFIASLILVNGKSEKIVLPKKSNVYVRAVGTGVINVYTDTDSAGKTTGIDYFAPSNFYAEFDECNSVFIEISPIYNSNASGLEITNLLISDGDTDSSYEALTDNTRQFLYPDIARTLTNAYDIFFDVALLSTVPVELFVDLQRTIITKLSLFPTNNADYFSGGGSTAVTLPSQEVIPSAAGNTSGLQSIEITLAEQQLTDQVTVNGIIPFDIMGGVSGTYLDYDYDMCVEGVTQQGALYTADCCSGVDELLYTQINYSLSSGFTYFAPDYEEMTLSIINTPSDGDEVPEGTIRKGKASAHLKQIADALDKDCVCQFEDFISEINERQEDVTYNDIISQLFGWTSRLPQRMINVFIRADTLFAVQRGQEKKTLDITGANFPYPTIEKKLMRTMWGSGKFGITPQTKEENADNRQLIGGIRVYPWPPTTSADGKTKYIYQNVSGYAGISEIGYALQKTETENDDGGRTIVTYIYGIVNGVYTCTAEESKTYDGEGKKVEEHKIIHDRLTRSQEFSRMEDEDGNTLASNVSSNLPGFYNESYVLQKPYEIGSEKTYQMISGYNRLVDSNFPVCDPDIYPKLIEAYAWLNRKTQETVKLDIYNYPHLIDFNDKIVLNGKEYFLVSNTAITTPHIFNRQSISIVRWY